MLCLVIEVPSAAGLGRRIVTSTKDPEESAGRLPLSRTGPDGSDFIAVEWPVTQRLANGTVRDDYERLTLVGVDTSRMSAEERESVRDSLRELRPEVMLSLASIDWDDQSHSHSVEVASLSEFLRRPAFSRLPILEGTTRSTAAVRDAEPSTVNRTRNWIGIAVGMVGIVCLVVWTLFQPHTPPPPPPVAARRTELMEAVCQAMSCPEDDLKRWAAAARGITDAEPAPDIDETTLDALKTATITRRFFAFDQTPSEQSQLGEFVESLSPSTAMDGAAIRSTLLEAYRHLQALRASAAEARRCENWRQAVDSGDQSAQVDFIASLLDFGEKSLPACGTDKVVGPFFGIDDHCRFRELATFFTDDARRGPLRKATGIDCQSGRQSEAFREAVATMPRTDAQIRRIATVGKLAYADTDCREFKDVVTHFSNVCQTLAGLIRSPEAP
jgi:hypothetical protein